MVVHKCREKIPFQSHESVALLVISLVREALRPSCLLSFCFQNQYNQEDPDVHNASIIALEALTNEAMRISTEVLLHACSCQATALS